MDTGRIKVPSERAIVKTLLSCLNSMPYTKAIKLHGSAFTEAGTPDILCICFGIPFLIEVKKLGGVISKLQEVRLGQWRNAQAKCLVAYSVQEALIYILKMLKDGQRHLLMTNKITTLDHQVKLALKYFN